MKLSSARVNALTKKGGIVVPLPPSVMIQLFFNIELIATNRKSAGNGSTRPTGERSSEELFCQKIPMMELIKVGFSNVQTT